MTRTWPDGLRRTASALWAVGAALAAFTGGLAVVHGEVGFAVVYGVVAAALATLAAATRRGRRVAELITLVGLGSQVIGAIGAAWELAQGSDDNAKARHLHDLGVNYRLALALNLAFSLLASAVFVWAVVATVGAGKQGRRRIP